VLLVHGYDGAVAAKLPNDELGAAALAGHGAAPGAVAGTYCLDFALTNVDLRAPPSGRMA